MTDSADDLAPGPVEPADEILESIHAFRRLFRALQHRAIRGGPHHELTPMESRVLRFLGRHPGATQSELVNHSVRDKGQMARLISALRDRNLVETRVDDADRRVHRLYLTPEGKDIDASVQCRRRALARVAVKGMTLGDQQALVELVDRLRANLEASE